MFAGCNNDENHDPIENNSVRERYLVNKIESYQSESNNSISEYIYNSENKLTQRITTGKMVENSKVRDFRYEHDFEYTNNLVSKIKIKDLTHNQFSYDIHLFYDKQNRLIRNENWKNGTMISYNNFYFENNRMVSIYYDDTKPFETNRISYDSFGNIIKHLYVVPKTDPLGNPIPDEFEDREYNYEYDTGLKPNFLIDYLFVYEALPGIGTVTGFARGLSNNNLSKYTNSGTTWYFSYNELGLPESYEMKWKDIETTSPMIWKISYKQIK